MCNKNSSSSSSSDIQAASVVNMKRTRKQNRKYFSSPSGSGSSSSSSSLKPLKRGNRTKTRKPKFVSLRLQLSESNKNAAQPKPKAQVQAQGEGPQPQLNLFPLHPESHDMQEEQNVALLFSSDGGGSLNGLLEDESTTTTSPSEEEGSLSALTCPAEDAGNWLVRKAMRRRESEEGSEERWVCYSEVVEEKKEVMEEVTSYCVTGKTTSSGLLSLKLDHEGILNAWSDKGSLYVAGEEAPQTVPDFLTGLVIHNAFVPHVAWEGWGSGSVGNAWSVPEICGANKVKEETGYWKLGQREASVQRYKEKRQSRLFSKKIRYEVRKLNAEKRPRMKGRFVKREGEV